LPALIASRSKPIATTAPIIQPIGPFPDVGAALTAEAGVAAGADAGTDADTDADADAKVDAVTGAEAVAISLVPNAA
jgi:hypothetical protein